MSTLRIASACRRLLWVAGALAAVVMALAAAGPAFALPDAGTDVLPVQGQVMITTRLGQETIQLSGTATVQHGAPHMNGSVQAVDTEIVALSLTGTSLTGPVSVAESPSLASTGKIQSMQPGSDYPASSFFDVFVEITAPASPSPTITLHNSAPLHLAGQEINGWPPAGIMYSATPNPCLPLLPADPMQACVNSASLLLGDPAVGGVAELAGKERGVTLAVADSDAGHGAGVIAGIAAAVALLAGLGGAGWASRHRSH